MKRFFFVNDGGASYVLVARDLEHAKQLLRDCFVEFTTDDCVSCPIDAPEVADVEWRELSTQEAADRRVYLGDGVGSQESTLAACDMGEWFSSEC